MCIPTFWRTVSPPSAGLKINQFTHILRTAISQKGAAFILKLLFVIKGIGSSCDALTFIQEMPSLNLGWISTILTEDLGPSKEKPGLYLRCHHCRVLPHVSNSSFSNYHAVWWHCLVSDIDSIIKWNMNSCLKRLQCCELVKGSVFRDVMSCSLFNVTYAALYPRSHYPS
jgi:hypothetical protein